MNRVHIEVQDNLGQPITIEVNVRRDTVECWALDRCQAVFNREALRQWLANPRGYLEADEVALARTESGYFLNLSSLVPWRRVQLADMLRLCELV